MDVNFLDIRGSIGYKKMQEDGKVLVICNPALRYEALFALFEFDEAVELGCSYARKEISRKIKGTYYG